MHRRQFLQAAVGTAGVTAVASSASAEGYRRCDQIHDKLTDKDIEHKWQYELPDSPSATLKILNEEHVPVPPIGNVAQGVAPEWYWLPEAAGTKPPEELKGHLGEYVPANPQRPKQVYRAAGKEHKVLYAQMRVTDFVSEVIPGYLTRQLGYAADPLDGTAPKPSVPGPLYKVRLGQPLVVRVTNEIDPSLGLDVSVHQHGGHTPGHSDGHPNFLVLPEEHVHRAESRDYYYPNPIPLKVDRKGPHEWVPREAETANFDYAEVPSTMWYHDHAEDITAHNALMGLAGFFILSDDKEEEWRSDGTLPSHLHDIPMVFKDVCLCPIRDPEMIDPHVCSKMKERVSPKTGKPFVGEARIHFDPFDHNGSLGNVILVNGAAFPRKSVKAERYWLRMLNGSLARHYNFEFWVTKEGQPARPLSFHRFGKDSWLFDKPMKQSSVFLGMANRADVLMDFSQLLESKWDPYVSNDEHIEVTLVSTLNQKNGRGPGHGANEKLATEFPLGIGEAIQDDRKAPLHLVKFIVERPKVAKPIVVSTGNFLKDDAKHPPLRHHERIPLHPKLNVREFNFERGRGAWQINHKFYDACIANAVPQVWSTELWILRNRSGGWWHPIHIHMESHQQIFVKARNHRGERIVLKRPEYDPRTYEGLHGTIAHEDLEGIDFKDAQAKWHEEFPKFVEPEFSEAGKMPLNFDRTVWNLDIKHDTTVLGPNTEVHLLMQFRTFQGPFVFHCHNLNHEDMRMMYMFDPRLSLPKAQEDLKVRSNYWYFTLGCDHKACEDGKRGHS